MQLSTLLQVGCDSSEESSSFVSGRLLRRFDRRDIDVIDRLTYDTSLLSRASSALRTPVLSLLFLLLTRPRSSIIGHIVRKLLLSRLVLREWVIVHAFCKVIEELGFVLGVDVLSEVLNRGLLKLSVPICAHLTLQCLLELVTHDG